MACSALIKMWIVCACCNQIKGSNTSSVAEDEVLRILVLVRNFLPGWRQTWEGKWNVAAIAHKAHDLSDKVVGTVGAGRIGQLLMQRLKVTTIYLISRNFGLEVTAKNCLSFCLHISSKHIQDQCEEGNYQHELDGRKWQ